MKTFIEYIDKCLPEEKGNKLLFKFKRLTLDQMNREFDEATSRGLTNERVFTDLVISHHNDLQKDYKDFLYNETVTKKRKRNLKLNVFGSIAYIVILILSFLSIGFSTHVWSPTWLIIADGILIWTSYILLLIVNRIAQMKRIFHVFARIFLAMSIVVFSVAAFLFCLSYLKADNSWLIVISGIAAMFIGDGIFILVKKQKLAIINFLIYIPAIAAMVLVIVGATGLIAWNQVWIVMFIGIIIDLCVAFGSVMRNKKYEQEVYSSWYED